MQKRSLSLENKTLLLLLCLASIGYFLLSDLMGGTLFQHQHQDSYTLQALNWLQGRCYLENGQQYTWLELAIYQGRYYVSFPPLPSVVLLPLVLLFGELTPNNLLVGLYGLLSLALAFRLMRQAGRSPLVSAFWALFLVWGSNMLWMTTYGGVWFQAQALNMVLCLAGSLAALRQKRALSCLYLALAVGCRPFSAVYVAAFYLWFVFEDKKKMGFWRACAANWRCFLGPVAVAAVLMWYNYIRFDNPLEFGHNWLPEFVEAEKGQFHLSYILPNLKNILFRPVTIRQGRLEFPRFNGFLLYVANPLFLSLFVCQLQNVLRRRLSPAGLLLSGAIVLNLLLLCAHLTFGGWQFGARYTCDLLPAALLYLALRGRERPRAWECLAGGFGVLFNCYGVIWMYLYG